MRIERALVEDGEGRGFHEGATPWQWALLSWLEATPAWVTLVINCLGQV